MLGVSRDKNRPLVDGKSRGYSKNFLAICGCSIEWHILVVEVGNIPALLSCRGRNSQPSHGDLDADCSLVVLGCSSCLPSLRMW